MIPTNNFTPGNTITIAVAIYKNNWKEYLKLSLVAHLWLLVPIYGWARYFAIAAWISRLSIRELSDNTQLDNINKHFSLRSLIILLTSNFLTILVLNVFAFILFFLIFFSVFLFYELFLQNIFVRPVFLTENFINGLLGLVFITMYSVLCTLLYIRVFVKDAVKDQLIIFGAIKKSYNLTKKNILKVVLIIWLSFLFSLPVWLISYFAAAFMISFVVEIIGFLTSTRSMIESENLKFILSFLVLWIGWVNLLIMPFWQSVKAVVYHQLNPDNISWNLASISKLKIVETDF